MTDSPVIRRSPVKPRDCNLARSFELIGDRWTLLILRSAMYGVRRFDDFQAELEILRSVLSAPRGAGRCRHHGAARIPRGGAARTHRISPDQVGSQLGLPFFAMTEWGDRWLSEGDPHFGLQSRANGQKLRVALVDERGKPAKPEDVQCRGQQGVAVGASG